MKKRIPTLPGLKALAPALQALLDAAPAQTFTRLPDSAQALTAWCLALSLKRSVVCITPGLQTLEHFHGNLQTLATALNSAATPDAEPALFFPPLEDRSDAADPDVDTIGLRLNTLLRMHELQQNGRPFVLATCIQSLMQSTPRPESLHAATRRIDLSTPSDPEELSSFLVVSGYEPVPEVQSRGQFARKGGLLDVWPVNDIWPCRIEFEGTDVASIRSFDPVTQRSTARPEFVRIAPVHQPEVAETPDTPGAGLLADLPPGTIILWTDTDAIAEHAAAFADRSRNDAMLQDLESISAALDKLPDAHHWRCETVPSSTPAPGLDFSGTPLAPPDIGTPWHPEAGEQLRRRNWIFIEQELARGQEVWAFFDTSGALDHFEKEFPTRHKKLHTRVGPLSSGFRSEALQLTVLSEAEIYGQKKARARPYDPLGRTARPTRQQGDRLADLTALRPGDLVVHMEHGLGRYLGLGEIENDGQRQEVVTIEYDEGAKLHVPVAHAHLLSRYVGASRQRPKLHRLGGKRWERERADAEKAIADMAAALLETQAQRALLEGFACPPDVPWQRDFEASFPFEETPDQMQAILDVKHDMESPRPMDRLVCGDAGYGKTEVALRAAFKSVASGKQVAVLVPTTVLAQQHFQTFSERMAPYPFRVEVLSRFSRGQHDHIVHGLADGTVDIVIGTHALIQPSVRFHNLGLAIIDEEQRFGVAHKERLKHIRRLVDVLTLTATPIPRTLYMGLTGSRDMSLLQTPPRQRMAIETIVTRNSDDIVREAILRELNREGQVFYLHNRIATIERVRQRLQRLVPASRIAVVHGQMSASELKDVMQTFVAGEADILLCTTIIESGLDIPRANTIFIDRADRFGIADLYQLRGRVGRSSHKAYAILLVPEHGHMDEDARKRIGAVQRHTALGAGFHLALQDLEIRGSGNLLGAQQSGHIAAIGFGLYCQLLQRTVARLTGRPMPPLIDVDVVFDFLDLSPSQSNTERAACIPRDYVTAEPMRMELYRRFAQCSDDAAITALRSECEDRFGPPPPAMEKLFLLATLRVAAHNRRIQSIRVRDDKLVLMRAGDYLMAGTQFPRLRESDPGKRLEEILDRVLSCDKWSKAN